MEYRTALIFLFLYYIRPQDWIPAIAGFNIVRPMIILWIVVLSTSRTRPAITGPLRTPHDWGMLAYYFYVVWAAPDSNATFKAFLPYVVFYSFTVHSLTTWERLLGYLKFWNILLVGVAAMAVGSLYGVDFTGARDVTSTFEGRLSLGTWLHNNPNALAHSVIVVLPLSYVLYFWSRGVGNRMVIFPAFAALACYCVYETESKGAFVVGGVLFVLIFVVGRPKFVQLLALAAAATMGVSALSFLPRMQEMGSLRSNEGVQGRLMVWEQARRVTKVSPEGVGWKQFLGQIEWEGQLQAKATHSSYVQVGGDLGVKGLFFYLLPVCLALRSLLTAARLTRDNPDQERCRRAILLLLIAYLMSGWLINREYHTEYFLLLAAAAAMHRLMLADDMEAIKDEAEEDEAAQATVPTLQPVLAAVAAPVPVLALSSTAKDDDWIRAQKSPGAQAAQDLTADSDIGPRLWNRITLMDLGYGAAMTWSVLFAWDYILKNL